jgi:hypothetical protein
MTADNYSSPEDAGTDTSEYKLSDDIKPNGMVTKVGGKKLDSVAKKPEMRKK